MSEFDVGIRQFHYPAASGWLAMKLRGSSDLFSGTPGGPTHHLTHQPTRGWITGQRNQRTRTALRAAFPRHLRGIRAAGAGAMLLAGTGAAVGACTSAGVPDPDARAAQGDELRRVATMGAARSTHTMTVLTTGEVLIVGGMGGEGSGLTSAELFDPRNDGVRETGSLASGRSTHSATLLRDGRVLIAGGYDGDYIDSIESYDPAAGRFVAAGRLTQARSGHTATLLEDGRVLFVGGVGRGWTFLSTAEIYDPGTERSIGVGSLSDARESHTATLLDDGSVLVIGGHVGRREQMRVHATAERFDPATGRFTAAGGLQTPRHKHDAVRLRDGRVLVIGGADRTDRLYYATTELFDPRQGAFSPGPEMAEPRYKIAGTSLVLRDGSVLVPSGAPAAEILDVGTWRFRTLSGRFPEAFHFAGAALLPGGGAVVAGGYGGGIRGSDGVWRIDYEGRIE